MNTRFLIAISISTAFFLAQSPSVQAADATGKILAVSSSTITLQSGINVWEIKRTPTTSVNGALKVGSTVTVSYATPDGQKREGPVTATNPAGPAPNAVKPGGQKKE
jgi:hypothetical protein